MPLNAPVRPSASAGAPPNPERDIVLPRLICWKPDHGPCELRRALTDTERGRLLAHSITLAHALAPFTPADEMQVRASLGAMFGGFRSMRHQGEDVVATTEITLAILREFPGWAIAEGCLRIVQGRAKLDRRFAPNDAEIFDAVQEVVRWDRKRLETSQILLAAQVPIARRAETPAHGRPPSGRLAAVTAWPSDGNRAARVAADLAARKASRDDAESGVAS
jgi:hypothetical protein